MLKTKDLCVGLNSIRMTLRKQPLITMHSNAKSLAILTHVMGFVHSRRHHPKEKSM